MKSHLAKSMTITPRSPQSEKETFRRLNTYSTRANPFVSETDLNTDNLAADSPKFSRIEAAEALRSAKESIKSSKKDSVVLKINLGPQGVKKVKCKLGDDPEELAKSFVMQNDLAPDAMLVIIKMMKKQLKEMAKRLRDANKDEIKIENDFSFSPNDPQEDKRIENMAQPSSESEAGKEVPKKKMKMKTVGLLAKLAVKVKPNESKEIKIHENDDPNIVVQKFCNDNGLTTPAKDAIMKNLVKLLRKSKENPPQEVAVDENSEPTKFESNTNPEDENLSTEEQTRPTQPESTLPEDHEEIQKEKAERYEQWQNLLTEKKEMRLKDQENRQSKLRGSDQIRQLFSIATTALDNRKRGPNRKSKSPSDPKKKSSPQGRTMTAEEAKKSGERLHARWKQKQEKLEKQRVEVKEKRAQEEMVDATFSPNRMHTFKRYLSNEPHKHGYMNTGHYFHQKKRWEQVGWELWAEECPFQPAVNQNSKNLFKNQTLDPSESKASIHEKLYQRGMEHKKHMEEWRTIAFQDHYAFHPTLTTDIQNFLPNRSFKTQAEFTETMYNEAKERDKRYQRRKLERYQSVDPNTGRKWFQPTINHDDFYWKVKTRDDAHFNLMVDVSNWNVKMFMDDKEKIKQEEEKEDPELRALFTQLDSDKDGYITIEKVNLDDLDQDMTQILYPFIEFLNTERPKLDFLEFCRAIQSFGIHEALGKRKNAEIKIEEAQNEDDDDSDGTSNPKERESAKSIKSNKSNKSSKPNKGSSSNKSKANSKKSDTSTASSVLSDQKVLPRHYQKLLTKRTNDK